MHLDRVGKGYGDWRWNPKSGIWEGRVVGGCREHHDRLDGNAQPSLSRAEVERLRVEAIIVCEKWADLVGVNLKLPFHPYEQWRELGSPSVGGLSY